MNRALLYLERVHWQRRGGAFLRGLRRPTRLLGLMAAVGAGALLVRLRGLPTFDALCRLPSLLILGSVLLAATTFRAFMRRGLGLTRAEAEFVLSGPFETRELLLYRWLPAYAYSLLTGAAFLALFRTHLENPLLTAATLTAFQIACHHLASAVALYADSLPDSAYRRLRPMVVGAAGLLFAVGAGAIVLASKAMYLTSPLPAPLETLLTAGWARLAFWPQVDLLDLGTAPALRDASLGLVNPLLETSSLALCQWAGFFSLGAAALLSPRLAYRFGGGFRERRDADPIVEAQGGDPATKFRGSESGLGEAARSAGIPALRAFRGAGSMAWKNLLNARRSIREVAYGFIVTAVYSAAVFCFLDGYESEILVSAVALYLGFLPLLLHRAFPFDFRADGTRLWEHHTLPFPPVAHAAGQLAIPCALMLICQALAVLTFCLLGQAPPAKTLGFMAASYPAIIVALSAAGNLHFLFFLPKGGSDGSSEGSGALPRALFAVGLTALAVGPAILTYFKLNPRGTANALNGAIAVQYALDLVLILMLAQLFKRMEPSD